MKYKFIWIILIVITLSLGFFYLSQPTVQLAGDIVEYYGISESILNHGGVSLTPEDQANLEKILHPAYFKDPGYYIPGRNGSRYPVHFIFYSFLVVPVRLLLQALNMNPLNSLTIINLLITVGVIAFIMRQFLPSSFQRLTLISLTFLSPLAFFFPWPGADIYYLTLLLLALFFFSEKKYLWASILAVLSSWHSQPVLVIAAGFASMFIVSHVQIHDLNGKKSFSIPFYPLILVGIPAVLVTIPYLYNLYAFGVLTPWMILQDGWTVVYGFGLHNASLWKLYEQFFDLNIGLFWYAPLIVGAGTILAFMRARKERNIFVLLFLLLITCFFFQTNPAWHYGTAGFGPSRHIIFALPFFIFFVVKHLEPTIVGKTILGCIVITQVFALSMNGYFLPNFENTLRQSPIATYVLNTNPSLYNPTPEIFFDRTNHTDFHFPTTAIYKDNGICKKAYVLLTEKDKLIAECGFLPSAYESQFDNEFLRKANYSRTVWTIEATFWPDTNSCEDWYKDGEYQCMKTVSDFLQYAGIGDASRIKQVENYTGVWRLERGAPVKITVPPGYIIQHYSFDGFYVTYN